MTPKRKAPTRAPRATTTNPVLALATGATPTRAKRGAVVRQHGLRLGGGETPVARGDESIPYPARPIHDYVRTKIEGEKLVRGADASGGLRTCAIRPVHIYGPDDPHAIVKSLESFASGSGCRPSLAGLRKSDRSRSRCT